MFMLLETEVRISRKLNETIKFDNIKNINCVKILLSLNSQLLIIKKNFYLILTDNFSL